MSRRLVLGSSSRQRLLALSPIGVVHGREVYPLRGAEGGDSAGSGDGTDSDDSGDDDEDDDDSDDSDDNAAKDQNKGRTRRGRTSEFNRIKRERNALLREKQERDKRDRDAELADRSEVEQVTAKLGDAEKERDTLRTELHRKTVELEIIKASHKKYDWADLEDVLNDRVTVGAIEIGPDGEVTGVKEALKDLAKRKPHFLASKSTTDDYGGTNNGNGNGRPAPQGSSGGNPGTNGNGGDPRAVDRQRLNQLYPALSRLPQ